MKRDDVRQKMSKTVTGRRRLYDENGKWTWFYPTSISQDCLDDKEQSENPHSNNQTAIA